LPPLTMFGFPQPMPLPRKKTSRRDFWSQSFTGRDNLRNLTEEEI
jgi:hypothetical protein